MTTYLFPGQGSQARGMGGDLFCEFSDLTQKTSDILGYSITELCLEDPEEKLGHTNYTQPALYVVNALTYLKKADKPTYVAGHSLGEYNALFAADVFDFETGLKLVQKRGELMSQATGGGMAAVVGMKSDDIQTLLQSKRLDNISIANYNSNMQIVISGPKADIDAAKLIFEEAGAKLFIPLKVSGAFHSSYMNDAQTIFTDFLKTFNFQAPTIPVIANITATPYEAQDIQTNLAKQITHPVRWTKTIEYLLAQGETEFVEIGPGTVLAGLVKRIQKGQ
ncbi:MAG: ACP S-malonyltransferase [Gammaproteobacteria bacterium]